jgi:hypothetical protein
MPKKKGGAAQSAKRTLRAKGPREQSMIQRHGVVVHYNPSRCIGFIQCRGEGTKLDKFFFHAARVVACECDPSQIKAGMFARFVPSSRPPKKEGDAPYATDVELYLSDPSVTSALQALVGQGGGK